MAKSKTPKGKIVNRIVEFPLTDEQKAARGTEAAKLADELDTIQAEKKKEMGKFKETITSLTNRIDMFLRQIHKGLEERDTVCTEVKNFDAQSVEYWMNGKIIDTREMTEEDRQLELDEHAEKKTKKKAKKFSEMRKMDPDTAEILKEQTSRKTAKSSVDGPRA